MSRGSNDDRGLRPEGVNPFRVSALPDWQTRAIETGREAMLSRLEELTSRPVKIGTPVARGSATMDEFSFRRADLVRVDRLVLFDRLRALADHVQEEEGVVLVYVNQRRYFEWRAPGLDLSAGQCTLVLLVLLLMAALVLFVLEVDMQTLRTLAE